MTNHASPTLSLGPALPLFSLGTSLCENPHWDPAAQILRWTDIPGGALYEWAWGTASPRRIYSGPVVGGFTRQDDGSLLLFRETDVARLTPDGQAHPLFEFRDEGSTRFNDVIADPEGRVFAGTIGRSSDSGGLFRLATDGTFTLVARGTGCSNGLAFSPALDALYWVCSTRRRIYRFPYERTTGEVGEAEIFHENSAEEGLPDGLTADEEGNLYSIRWGAEKFGLVVFEPGGKIIHRQAIPAKAPTSLCFCGPGLNDVAITTADDGQGGERAADLLMIADLPIKGREEFRSRIETGIA